MKKLKYAVMGTHGVGKTLIAMKMACILKDENPGLRVGMAQELARICPYPLNEDMTEASQRWLFHAQIKMELEYEKINDILVCDRTVMDCLAYAIYGGYFEMVSEHVRIAVEWFKSYDHVFWIRPKGHDLAADRFRSVDVDFQVAVDQYFKELVEDHRLNVDQRISLAHKSFITRVLPRPAALAGGDRVRKGEPGRADRAKVQCGGGPPPPSAAGSGENTRLCS